MKINRFNYIKADTEFFKEKSKKHKSVGIMAAAKIDTCLNCSSLKCKGNCKKIKEVKRDGNNNQRRNKRNS